MGYGLEDPGSIPESARFFSSLQRSNPTLGPTQPPIQWVLRAIFRGVKWPGREADHSPASNAEVNNGGGNHPLPHTSS
jgi:hypothetical protein